MSAPPILISFPERRRLAVVDDRPLPAEIGRVDAGLTRAMEHIERLHSEIQQWRRENRIEVRLHSSPDLRTHWWTAHIPSAPMDEWGVLVGEVLHNLRSTLDRAVFVAAQHVSGEESPPGAGQLAFPVATSPKVFRRAAKHRLRPFAEADRRDVIDAVEAMQPYYDAAGALLTADRAAAEGLGLLTDLHNKDKHQRPHQVSFAAPASTAEYVTSVPMRSWTAKIGAINDGGEVGRVVLTAADVPSIRFAQDFVVSVHGMPLYGPSMLAALHGVATEALYGFARTVWRGT